MAMSTIYVWFLLGCGLATFYFLACKLTEERVKKWARKGLENETELQVKRLQTFTFPLFVFFTIILDVIIIFAGIATICDDLSNKITGRWPVCEGTIVGWYDGYRGKKGSAMIQVGDKTKGYDIRNGNIQEGELVGVTVRMAYNGDIACILEYKQSGMWVREMYLPNYGREVNAVSKTIAMNILAGALTCGLILKKMVGAEKATVLKSKIPRNALGGFLIVLTFISEGILCLTVLNFEKTWQGETQMIHSQLFLLVLICINVLLPNQLDIGIGGSLPKIFSKHWRNRKRSNY